jgi:hypothetical protein
MGPLDAFWHLTNFFLPALWVAALAAAGAKWIWRRELAGVAWRRLAGWSALAGAAALVGGLVITGHDGRMLTYGAMVLAAALALWWVGFGAMRRR